MADLLFIDSYAHYDSTNGANKYLNGAPAPDITFGRTGWGIHVGAGALEVAIAETADPHAGISFNTPNMSNAPLSFRNAVSFHSLSMSFTGDGRLIVRIDDGASGPDSISAATPICVSANNWYFLEFGAHMYFTGTFGSTRALNADWEVRVNGHSYATGTVFCPAVSSTTPTMSVARITGPGGGSQASASDFYVATEFLGDVTIDCLFPSADGDELDWITSTGTPHFSLVNEHVPDGDTTYVTSSAVNDIDLYEMDDITGFSGSILGVQGVWYVKKTNSGACEVTGQYKSGGTVKDAVGPQTPFPPSDLNYRFYTDAQRKSLFTLSDWTVAEINAMQVGLKRTL